MPEFNEIWYSDSQCDNIAELIKQTADIKGLNIEIGCWEGKSTIALANACFPEFLYCNDTWEGNIEEAKVTGLSHPSVEIISKRDVFGTFNNNMKNETKGNYIIIKKDCHDWLISIKEEIKFVHIDASHDYFSVKKTILEILPNLVYGGILCGDDFLSAGMNRLDLYGGVERAVRELLPGFKSIDNLWYWKNENRVD